MCKIRKLLSVFCLSVSLSVLAVGGSVVFEPEVVCAASATVKSASISMKTGGDFIKGRSNATVAFKISGSSKVTVSVIDESNKTVYSKKYSKCKSGAKYTFSWNGKKSNGKYAADGEYRVMVKAGSSTLISQDSVYFRNTVEFKSGDGSKKKPYQVQNASQLQAVAKYNGRCFVQTKDIDCSGISFVPMFPADAGFSGVYDGKNFTISNISYQSSSDGVGIFRGVTAEGLVKNVALKDSSLSGRKYVGGIVGWNSGTVSNCKVNDCVINGESEIAAVAAHNSGKVEKCMTSDNILSASQYSVAPIVGYDDATGYISNCTSSTDTVNASNCYAGGIVGYLCGTVSGCKANDNSVRGNNWSVAYAGGIAGKCEGIIKKCEVMDSNNKITGPDKYVGGIAGRNSGTIVDCTYLGQLPESGHD